MLCESEQVSLLHLDFGEPGERGLQRSGNLGVRIDKVEFHETRGMSPNDPKLSDDGRLARWLRKQSA